MKEETRVLVVLTQYKRNYLEQQLKSIYSQSLKPDYLVVFQNENHHDVTRLKKKYDFIHIKSDYNTKFFGRFSICFSFPVDICVVMDDDIISGKDFLKHYVSECIRLNGIMGGNSRYGILNSKIEEKDRQFTENIRENRVVDFVGHVWCFKKDWLYHMFSIKPFTYDTGEDMHLCFSCKVKENIKSYLCSQPTKDSISDLTEGKRGGDKFNSFGKTPKELRKQVEEYFIKNHNLEMVDKVEKNI